MGYPTASEWIVMKSYMAKPLDVEPKWWLVDATDKVVGRLAADIARILMGKHPRDEWSAHPGVMPVLDDARIAQIKATYDLCLVRFGHLQMEEMLTWDEPAEGVQRTRFGDGTEVVADFNTRELRVNNDIVAPPVAEDPR